MGATAVWNVTSINNKLRHYSSIILLNEHRLRFMRNCRQHSEKINCFFHINSATLFIKSHVFFSSLIFLCFKLFDRLFLCCFQFPVLTFILEFYSFGKYRRSKVCVCVCELFPKKKLLQFEIKFIVETFFISPTNFSLVPDCNIFYSIFTPQTRQKEQSKPFYVGE